MQTSFLPASGALVSLLLAAGCSPRPDHLTALETVIVGPEYSENKGLFVPDDTRRSLGLKVVDVGEDALVAHFDFSARIYDVSGERARASGTVTPAQAQALRPGQPVVVTTRAGEDVAGTLTALRPEMEKLNGTIEVLVEFPRPAGAAVSGFVTARVALESGGVVALVPKSALVETTAGAFVYTESGDHFVRTAVTTGARTADTVAIVDGLYAGDRVVAEPAMSLWLTELAAINGGHACCALPPKGK